MDMHVNITDFPAGRIVELRGENGSTSQGDKMGQCRQSVFQNIGCPTRYRTWHFFNNFTSGWRTAAPCRNNQVHYRHTLHTHSSSYLTQRTYSCPNFVAISSMPGSVASGTPYTYYTDQSHS